MIIQKTSKKTKLCYKESNNNFNTENIKLHKKYIPLRAILPINYFIGIGDLITIMVVDMVGN